MPELPEVEVLARHLRPLVRGKTIRRIVVRRAKVIRPTSLGEFRRVLAGARFISLKRRGKYLLFRLCPATGGRPVTLLGHLGMTGRFYLTQGGGRYPKHTAVVLDLGDRKLVYEDTRYFGRLTLSTLPLTRLGPEPLDDRFDASAFAATLDRSNQAIKVRLLDQTLVAGIGNIYASEALFRARIHPRLPAGQLSSRQIRRLWRAIRNVLGEAIQAGSTLPLNFAGGSTPDRLFYFGRAPSHPEAGEERLRVYDREGDPCSDCGTSIERLVQGGRSTFYCPHCQR